MDQLRGAAQVRQVAQGRAAVVEHEAHGLDRVVRHGEGLHGHVLDLEVAARAEELPVAVLAQALALAPQDFRRERIAVDGQRSVFAAEHLQAAGVVAVLVREQHAVEFLGAEARLFQAHDDLARAQARVDQQPAVVGGQEGAVARAAAAQDGEGEHACVLSSHHCSRAQTRKSDFRRCAVWWVPSTRQRATTPRPDYRRP